MLKKTITYTDFDGNERKEDFYFNLTKAEVAEMEMTTEGGMSQQIERIVAEKDAKRIMETFKGFILKSYGQKSPDGKRFIKNQELRDGFEQTEAYSTLFMELCTNADAANSFIAGIIPSVSK